MHGFALLRRGALLGVLGCLAAVALAIPTTAAAKVTDLTSCQPVSSPGDYRLDADVTASPGLDCFDITASDVTLHLHGHTITGSGSGALGIAVVGSGDKVEGPGTVTGFTDGIVLGGGNGSVRHVTSTGNIDGIFLFSKANSVRHNVTTGNDVGILADRGATGNTIIGNFAQGNTVDDLSDDNANCDSNVWRGNDFGTANQSCIN